jgi:FlaA1/EpsC-like NDP-sugar epimerase
MRGGMTEHVNTTGLRSSWAGATDADPRLGWIIAADLAAWIIAVAAANSFYAHQVRDTPTTTILVILLASQLIVGTATGLYRGRFRRFSFDEAGAVAVTAGIVGTISIVVEQILWNGSRTGQILVLSTSMAVCAMFGHRYVRRVRAQHLIGKANRNRTPLIVYGAGEGGYRAVTAMQALDAGPYRPVAFIDDDPHKRQRRMGGVRVEGTSDDLEKIARRYGAHEVLLAIPSATGPEIHRLHLKVKAAGFETLVMPPVQRLVGKGSAREFTRYTDEDVLDRHIVEIDPTAVRELVADRTVLVTGAGGSIGSELVRQLVALQPAKVVAVDRDDSLLHDLMASLPHTERDRCIPVLADVRDVERLDDVFSRHTPDLVFHAAALKHVPALEGAPSEGWKTNVQGTANVVAAAERHNVSRLVNISTDKAAAPVNVLGYTKRLAERVTAAAAHRTGRPYVSVRFGNVIGSRGSALETFERQIAEGGPVTVTDPEVTRYFMAVREAVRLTMQAAAIGRSSEVLVLDMGQPVKVIDIARQLIEQSGTDVDIVITGLRPGEKMHEVLLGDGEHSDRPFNPLIDHVTVPPLDIDDCVRLCAEHDVSPRSLRGLSMLATLPTGDDFHPQVVPSAMFRTIEGN